MPKTTGDDMSESIPPEYEDIFKRIKILEEKLEHIMNDRNDPEHIDLSINIPAKPKIRIKPNAFYKILDHAFEFANDRIPREDWVEVIGMLTGVVENKGTPAEQIVIRDYWPIGSGDGVSVNIMDAEPVLDVYRKKKPDEFIVGWAHSHPSYSPFLSADDIATQLRYQALWEDSVALVIDPVMISPSYYGFSIFRLSSDRQHYYELDCEIEGLTPQAAFDAYQVFLKKKLRG